MNIEEPTTCNVNKKKRDLNVTSVICMNITHHIML